MSDSIENIFKQGFNIHVSSEMLAYERYSQFSRKVDHYDTIPVDPAELKAFKKWRKKREESQEIGYAKGWLFDAEDSYNEPADKKVPVYGETDEEFRARVDAARVVNQETGQWPEDTQPWMYRILGTALEDLSWLPKPPYSDERESKND